MDRSVYEARRLLAPLFGLCIVFATAGILLS